MVGDMHSAEFRVHRESLGLPIAWIRDWLEVGERSVWRWEDGKSPIPDGVAQELLQLVEVTRRSVDSLCAELSAMPVSERRVLTYRTDTDFRAHQPDTQFPASWHRAVVARAAERVTDCEVRYWTGSSESE